MVVVSPAKTSATEISATHPALARLPDVRPPSKPVSLRVTPASKKRLMKHHPWVFDAAITHQSIDDASCGQLAVVYGADRAFLGVGLTDPTSPIRVRLLAHKTATTIDAAFFKARLEAALKRRGHLEAEGTDGYRVLHGENDGFPGLVLDRYADTAVLKIYTPAWVPWLRTVFPLIVDAVGPKRVILRFSRAAAAHPDLLHGLKDGDVLYGDAPPDRVRFRERHLFFEADPIRGQKTGFFLDQRDNRARVEERAKGKRVLNVFSYSGGFSLTAARGGAREVVAIDRSAPANAEAANHFSINADVANVAACAHRTITGDAFGAMEDLAATNERFDVVIIDPPSFAHAKEDVDTALRAYTRLATLGLGLVTEGGHLVFASCSSRIDEEQLEEALRAGAATAQRYLHIVERTSHADDHPIGFPEGRYLKCLFADVE